MDKKFCFRFKFRFKLDCQVVIVKDFNFTEYPFETRATEVHLSTRKGPYSPLFQFYNLTRMFPYQSSNTVIYPPPH